jgi:peptidoglycan hydrolase-like protein with peptidoglycan-binding domain
MKKRTLLEEIKRIQEITYGEKVTKDGFIGNILKEQTSPASNIDNSKKADAANKDDQGNQVADPKLVENFYSTFEKAIAAGGISQKQAGSMMYEKEVESMQIALVLLGYQLPQHGIDGLFGPETAGTVQKFATDKGINLSTSTNKTMNESSQELRSTINKLGYKEKGSEIASGGEITNELSSIVSKVLNDFKTSNPNIQVTLTGGNDKFHQGLGYKSKHTEGQAVDLVIDPFNNENANSFVSLLDKYKGQDPKFSYIDEYRHPSGAATAGHFHLQYGEGVAQGGPSMVAGIKATPEFLTKLLELVKGLNLTPEKLKEFMKKNIGSGGNGGVIDVKDFPSIINTIIDNLEGGYYNPDMLRDGRVTDSRYGASGETMFGIDRKTGPESNTPAGQKFWALIDSQPDKANWRNEYMAKDKPELNNQLRQLVAEMMKPFFEKYTKDYLSPESAAIVSKDPALTFHFVYATFNGSGWFQKFARLINNAVTSGNTDPKSLLALAMQDRVATSSSLMNQVGAKVAKITSRIQSPTQTDTSRLA